MCKQGKLFYDFNILRDLAENHGYFVCRTSPFACAYTTMKQTQESTEAFYVDPNHRKCRFGKAQDLFMISPALKDQDGVIEAWVDPTAKLRRFENEPKGKPPTPDNFFQVHGC